MTPKILPVLVVFTLDHVFWPYYQDARFQAPFLRNSSTGKIVDSLGTEVTYYEEVAEVLSKLKNDGIMTAVMALTKHAEACHHLLQLLDWNKYFAHKEISLLSALNQLRSLHNTSGINYSDMLHFAESEPYTRLAAKIGVFSVYPGTDGGGITLLKLEEALKQYEIAKQSNASKNA